MSSGPASPAAVAGTAEWQRLDPRMLLVHPVKELLRFLPVLVGIVVARTASGGAGDWWSLVGVLVPVSLGVLRYCTTSFRVTAGRIELRRGLLNRHVLAAPLDRVRTVDITAPPVHRLLGLVSVRVGTGTASTDDDEQLDLDGLPAEQARRLRAALLSSGPAPEGVPPAPEAPVLTFDPSWVRFAPFTSAGLALAGGVVALVGQSINYVGGFDRLDPERVARNAEAWSPWVAVPAGILAFVVVVSALAIGGYAVTNWGFALTHTGPPRGGSWHLRRGLVTTRETTLDDERLRGVVISEPLPLRAVGGARASAIVTGLGQRQQTSAVLVPPAPRPVVARVTGAVLRTPGPAATSLVVHGPRARRRRFTRALGPALGILVAAVVLVGLTPVPAWVLLPATAGLPLAVALAVDRYRALGHALVDGHLVVRSGSIDRRREALEVDGIIGWNQRSTFFQRRAGLTTLAATTAGGRQAVRVPDVDEGVAVALAASATPGLLDPFLDAPAVDEPVRAGTPG